MKDITQWIGWYGVLVALPLFLAELLVKDRMPTVAPQRVRAHRG